VLDRGTMRHCALQGCSVSSSGNTDDGSRFWSTIYFRHMTTNWSICTQRMEMNSGAPCSKRRMQSKTQLLVYILHFHSFDARQCIGVNNLKI